MPAEDGGEKNSNRNKHHWPRRKSKKPAVPGLAAFVHAYRDEQAANRKQEATEDQSSRSLEKWTLGFVVLTTIGIFIQAAILHNSDDAIQRTAAAAINSANTARDGLVKAQRPFIYEKSIWYRAFIKDDKKAWRAIMEWENSGLTPTKTAFFELSCASIPFGRGIVVDPYALKKMPGTNIIRVSAILAPKQAKFGGQCEFFGDELLKAQRGESTQYLIGQVNYTDIFDVRHLTRFCEFIYHIGGDVAGYGNIEVSSNSCVRHNCADEECAKEDAEPNLPPEKLSPPKP